MKKKNDDNWEIVCDPTAIATATQFEDALLKLRNRKGVSTKELAIFQAFASAPAHTLTAQSLAEACDLTNMDEANLRFGQLARAVAEELHFQPRTHYSSGFPRWWPTIAYSDGEKDGHWQWRLRPELLDALATMRWVRI